MPLALDKKLDKEFGRQGLALTLKRLSKLALNRFSETNIVEISSSMTLATVLSIVPLLAVALAVFSVIPAFAVYRKELELILANVIPGQYSIQIFHYLRGFSEHARGLSAFGFAGVALSAWFLIDKIFKTINQIFRVRHQRSIAQKAVLYWALLTLGPVVTVGSITVTTYLARLALSGFSGGIVFWGLNTLTFIIQTLGYSAMFYAIPNCRVKWRDAMAGGLFTSVVGLVVKWGFSAYISHGTLTSLYGAFVALPVFLLWIYATWILIFAGAGVTATLPMIASGRFGDTYKHGNSYLLWEVDKDNIANQSAISLIIRATGICWNQVVCKGMARNKGISLKQKYRYFIGTICLYFRANIYYHISMKGENI